MNPPLPRRSRWRRLDLFELGALPYDRLTRGERWRRAAGRMAARLPPRQGDAAGVRVLDVGAGPGGSAEGMALAEPALRVVALDRSRAMVRRAQEQLGRPRTARADAARANADLDGRVTVLQGDALALPFRNGALDGVTGHSLLYLLPSRARALAEFHRVLRPGGRLILMEPRRGLRLGHLRRVDEPVHLLAMALWRAVSVWRGRFGETELARLLESAGFKTLAVEPVLDGLGLLATAEKPSSTPFPAGVDP